MQIIFYFKEISVFNFFEIALELHSQICLISRRLRPNFRAYLPIIMYIDARN